jgi:hypothetical protein
VANLVYSERILAYANSGSSPNYVVPGNKRLVVKGISADNTGNLACAVVIYVQGMALWAVVLQAQSAAAIGGQMLVAYKGEQVHVYISQAGCAAQVSGYLLDDPAPLELQEAQSYAEAPGYDPDHGL